MVRLVMVKKREVVYYPAKEMGTKLVRRTIRLSDSFFRRVVINNLGVINAKDLFAEVGCPFCEEGYLMLISDRPRYGFSPRKKEDKAIQLKFICSNCPGRFVASYHWLRI